MKIVLRSTGRAAGLYARWATPDSYAHYSSRLTPTIVVPPVLFRWVMRSLNDPVSAIQQVETKGVYMREDFFTDEPDPLS